MAIGYLAYRLNQVISHRLDRLHSSHRELRLAVRVLCHVSHLSIDILSFYVSFISLSSCSTNFFYRLGCLRPSPSAPRRRRRRRRQCRWPIRRRWTTHRLSTKTRRVATPKRSSRIPTGFRRPPSRRFDPGWPTTEVCRRHRRRRLSLR